MQKSKTGYDKEELYFHELNQKLIKKMRESQRHLPDNVIPFPIDRVRSEKKKAA